MSMIEVLKIAPLENSGNLRVFVSVKLGGVTIHDCRVVQQPGQSAWVSMPQREYAGQDGKRRFAPVVELSDSLKEKVSAAVLEAWKKRK